MSTIDIRASSVPDWRKRAAAGRREEETMPKTLLALLLAGAALSPLTPAVAQAKGELTAAFAAEGTVLDPIKYSAGVDHYFIGQMFEQLVRADPDLKEVNWLAESWEIGGDASRPV